MPRKPRVDEPGCVHHVWTRGIDGRSIFLSESDRHDLLQRFSRVLPGSGMDCLAWAFMPNHLHVVLRTGKVPLSTVMKRIHTGFAMRFNGVAERSGYLFQSRFGSRPLLDEGALRVAIVYVLRNPLAAGLVADVDELERYAWCGLGALVGRRPPLPFESVQAAFEQLGLDHATARGRLREWLTERETANSRRERLDELIAEVCREFGIAAADLLDAGRRTRSVSRGRARICRRALVELRLRPSAIARALGLGASTVTQALRRDS